MTDGILISCCNVKRPFGKYSLVYFRFSDRRFFFVDWTSRTGSDHRSAGMTGIVRGDGCYYAGVQTGPESKLAVFGHDLQLADVIPLPGIRDVHGLRIANGQLLAVSTGTNQIFAVDPSGDRSPSIYWDAAALDVSWNLHLNDYIEFDGRRLVLTHRPLRAEMTGAGTIFDIDRNAVFIDGMSQPHTLTVCGSRLLVCDSRNSSVISVENGSAAIAFQQHKRFLRGMTPYDGGLIVAASASRVFSRSLGTNKRYANELVIGDKMYMSSLLFLRQPEYSIKTIIPFSEISLEIYDIIPIDFPPSRRILVDDPASIRAQAAANRMNELEQIVDKLSMKGKA